jgi:hypothetical protein
MNRGKGLLDLFHESDGQLTIRKDTQHDVETATLPRSPQLDPPKVGTADGKTLGRGHVSTTRSEQRAPQLLLRQEQQGKKKGRPRTSPLRNLAREDAYCDLTPLDALACVCGHDKPAHWPDTRFCQLCICTCFTPAQIEQAL